MALKPFRRDSMSRRVRIGALVFILAAIGAYVWRDEPGRSVPAAPPAASRAVTIYTGRVVDVSDGDSVRFATASGVRKIRLDSIDAPERSAGRDRPGQPHAEASRRHLEQWLAGRRVTAHCHASDQYGRDVCIVQDAQGATATVRKSRVDMPGPIPPPRGVTSGMSHFRSYKVKHVPRAAGSGSTPIPLHRGRGGTIVGVSDDVKTVANRFNYLSAADVIESQVDACAILRTRAQSLRINNEKLRAYSDLPISHVQSGNRHGLPSGRGQSHQ